MLLDVIRRDGRLQVAFIDVNLQGSDLLLVDVVLESGRNLDGSADILVTDLILPVRGKWDNLKLLQLPDVIEDSRRIFPADDHDFGNLFLSLTDNDGDSGSQAGGQKREKQQRNKKRRNECAAIAQSFGQLLAIDNADILER